MGPKGDPKPAPLPGGRGAQNTALNEPICRPPARRGGIWGPKSGQNRCQNSMQKPEAILGGKRCGCRPDVCIRGGGRRRRDGWWEPKFLASKGRQPTKFRTRLSPRRGRRISTTPRGGTPPPPHHTVVTLWSVVLRFGVFWRLLATFAKSGSRVQLRCY